jgi:ABC-type uncharacterized transport system permease subunit
VARIGSQGRDDRPDRTETGETEQQRWQRNYEELLQELRVAQTGVQILFAFLLTIAFTARFPETDPFTRTVYLVALLASAAATALIIAPVALHRALFRRGQKPHLTRTAHRLAYSGLAMMLVAMVAAVLLASDMVISRAAAWVAAGAVGVWFVALWAALPLFRRSRTDG